MDSLPQKSSNLLKELVKLLVLVLVLVTIFFFVIVYAVISFFQYPLYIGMLGVAMVNVAVIVYICTLTERQDKVEPSNEEAIYTTTVEVFIDKLSKEKPIRFTARQLEMATVHYSKLLGTGGFGSVYKGSLLNGVDVAVKLLSNDRCESSICDQFFAEISTIGTTNHLNLVKLYGFCFEGGVCALVYECMENGSLDQLLFNEKKKVDWKILQEIASGTARGMAYLHEECEQIIIHYDIKPANILLGADFQPKVADFGLARLCNRDNSQNTLSSFKGTPGYAAPELWMPSHITHKCDVYSFGMVLFEILGKRRNLSLGLPESQEWFPTWVWKKFEEGKMGEVFVMCEIDQEDRMAAERMAMVGMWCVQYRPELRPLMSVVANMLEGVVQIPIPPYPFKHNMDELLGVDGLRSSQLGFNAKGLHPVQPLAPFLTGQIWPHMLSFRRKLPCALSYLGDALPGFISSFAVISALTISTPLYSFSAVLPIWLLLFNY